MCSSFSNYSMFNNQHLFCLGVGGGEGLRGLLGHFIAPTLLTLKNHSKNMERIENSTNRS